MSGTIVLGAGLAGLGCARHLPGCRVFEAANHPGGRAFSHEMGGICFDQGLHVSRPAHDHLARDVAALDPLVVSARWQGRWLTHPVHHHLRELPQELRIRALADLAEAQACPAAEPADYREWCQRRYGRFLTASFIDDFTAKFWRVPAEALAADWLDGRRATLTRIVRGAFTAAMDGPVDPARYCYPARGGFFAFFAPLYRGLDIIYGERAVEIDPRRKIVRFDSGRAEGYDVLASSIPLADLVRMTRAVPNELRDLASDLRSTQLLCVNLIVDRPRLSDCHWVYVFDCSIEAARVSFPGTLAPGSVPEGRTALQAEIFRRDDEPFEIDNLVERTIEDMAALFGFSRWEVRQAGHVHIQYGNVIPYVDRAQAAAKLLDWFAERHIHGLGGFGRWQHVGPDEAYRQGCETAERLARRLGVRLAA